MTAQLLTVLRGLDDLAPLAAQVDVTGLQSSHGGTGSVVPPSGVGAPAPPCSTRRASSPFGPSSVVVKCRNPTRLQDRAVGTEGVELSRVELMRMEVSARCGCGELVERGEHAGFDPDRRELLCLWCLADLQADRPRPRRRTSRPGVPERVPTVTAPSADVPTSYRVNVRSGPAPRRGHAPHALLTALLTLLLVGGALVARPYLSPADGNATAGAGGAVTRVPDIVLGEPLRPVDVSGAPSSWPPVPDDAGSTPLGRPATSRSSATSYQFMDTTPAGAPVAWDPCRPIHVVVNSAQAPAGADRLLREATAELTEATGLQFVLDGSTTEPPASPRPPTDRTRYGNRWSPVLVAWTDDRQVPQLAGNVVGLGGPVMAPYRGAAEMHFVSGLVYLDGEAIASLARTDDGHRHARAILMHELAHLVGLTHVDDARELMFPRNEGQTVFGPGDLEGLRRLGGGRCFSR